MKKFNSGHLALFITAALFGAAFIFQRHAAQLPSPDGKLIAALWFIFWRLLIATVFMGLCFFIRHRLHPQDEGRWLYYGGIAAFFMFGGMLFQQWGLAYTSVGKSGFITGLYVVFVPLVALCGGYKQSKAVWIAVTLAVIGLACFAGIQSDDALIAWNLGDTLTLLCAFCWAFQVLWAGFSVRRCNILAFSVAQLAGVCLLTFLILCFSGKANTLIHIDWLSYSFWDLLATGIGSSALAFFMQAVGQRRVPAAHAAVIMSLESVFAMLFGWAIVGETVTAMMLIGSIFMFTAMMSVQYDEISH